MKDDLVSQALHDPMDSRRANESAWAQMAGVIMRFSQNTAYVPFMPPAGLSPRQRAIWLVAAFSAVAVSSFRGGGAIRMALTVASGSYADLHGEREILNQAQTAIGRAKEHWLSEPATP